MDYKDVYQRSLAAYLGFAIGDALGATTEFMRPHEIQTRYQIHKDLCGGGWLHLKPGKVTDDTEMSLALGDALVETGGINEVVIAEHFVKWMRSKPTDIGHTIRQGLSRFKLFRTTQAPYSEYAASNGSLMRNLPVIIASIRDEKQLDEWSTRQSIITHNNTLALAGTLMISQLARLTLLEGQSAPLKLKNQEWIDQYPRFDHRLYKRSYDGHIVDTVRTVLYYFFNTYDFESCLIGVVNAGGDADTNGAIAGMLAASFYGVESIPHRWLKKLDPVIKKKIKVQVDALFMRFVACSQEV